MANESHVTMRRVVCLEQHRPHCTSEPPNHRALAHVEEWSASSSIAAMHLTETELVHSHAEPDSLAAHGYATWTIVNYSSLCSCSSAFSSRLCDASTRLDYDACGATIAFADASHDCFGLGAASAMSLRRL